MPNGTHVPVIIGDLGELYGWRRQHEMSTSDKEKERLWRGPFQNFSLVWDALHAAGDADGWKFSASHQPGSSVAEIRATKPSGGSDGPESLDDLKIAPDTYSLDPVVQPTALEAHPRFAGDDEAPAKICALRDFMDRGDREGARRILGENASSTVAGGDNAAIWLALYGAGVRSFDAVAWRYRCVRHYSADRSNFARMRQWLAADVQSIMEVSAWADVEGTGDAPFAEPKWMDTAGGQGGSAAAASYEWRFDGLTVSGTESEVEVAWCYTGAWKWSKALYKGGSWEPGLP